jgi:predicted  nucleic acid-binding Zn-ribbon protein
MNERPEPDLDRVRDAMREHDERVEEDEDEDEREEEEDGGQDDE